MGYDGGIIIVKKKAVEKVQKLREELEGLRKEIEDENVFDEYFRRKPLENGESRIIPKSIYDDFLKWIEDKIKSTTLYDIAIGKIDDYTVHAYINVYKLLKDLTIDWNKEYVVFRNDW